MNGYIINPAWFYWADTVNDLATVMFIIATILLVGVGFALIFSMMDDDFIENRKTVLKAAIAGTTCMVIAILIPSKETLIEMQIAKYVTWENAEWTIDAIKDAVDYIVNAIGSIR